MNPKRFEILFGATFVFVILFIIYLLSFSGIPASDDEQLFAVTARNLAVLNHFDAEPLYGNLRIAGDYHGVEPAFAVLASFGYRIMQLFNVGHLQSLYLLPIFYVSLSAGVLVLLIVQLGFSTNLAVEIALLYGLSTIVWPYAKTFFREPLILLLILLSWLFFERMGVESGKVNKKFSLLFCLAILLLCLTKLVYGILLLPYMALLFSKLRQAGYAKSQLRRIFLLLLTVCAVISVVMFSISSILEIPAFYRFSKPFLLELWARFISGPHADLGTVLSVSLFSPWKGFFVYSPVCALASLTPFFKKTPRLMLFMPLCVLFALLTEQWVMYETGWWNPTWASRVLMPVVPLMLVACLPVYKFLRTYIYGKFLLLVIALWGFALQLNAILVNSSLYTTILQEKATKFPDSVFWDFSLSPMLTQWRALSLDDSADTFLLRLIRSNNNSPGFLLLLIGVICLLAVIFIGSQRKNSTLFSPKVCLALLPLPAVVLLSAFLPTLKLDPFYNNLIGPVEQVCQKINASFLPDDLMVVKPYPSRFWYAFLNQDCIQNNWYSLPHDYNLPDKETAQALVSGLIHKLPSKTARIWLIQPVAQPDADISLLAELNKLAWLESETFVDQGSISIQRYTIPPTMGCPLGTNCAFPLKKKSATSCPNLGIYDREGYISQTD